MKAPSKNISASIRSQRAPGRSPITVEVGKQKRYGPSMTTPGEGGTEMAPGTHSAKDGRQERSAAAFAQVMNGKVG